MMKDNNAAKSADQEIEAIMEQAQVFASAWAFFLAGSSLEQAERERSNLRALLSKLRAEGVQAGEPVADERAAFEEAMQRHGQSIDRWPNPHGGYRKSITDIAWYVWLERAALANPPAYAKASDAELDKLYRETITEGPENDIRCWENSHRLYARAVLARYAPALASAPVAEATLVKASNTDTRDVDVEVHAFGSIFYDHGPNLAEALGRLAQRVARWRNMPAPSLASAPVAGEAHTGNHHTLKTDPEVFQAVMIGAKTFEIRFNDRGFQVGDALRLRETRFTGAEMREGKPLEYTGRECHRVVSHVLMGYGLTDGWCCLSFAAPQATVTADMIRSARDAYDKAPYPDLNKWKHAVLAVLESK